MPALLVLGTVALPAAIAAQHRGKVNAIWPPLCRVTHILITMTNECQMEKPRNS